MTDLQGPAGLEGHSHVFLGSGHEENEQSLIRDTGGTLLDVNPDPRITAKVRELIESVGDRLIDLHLWRLGPGHLGAVISVTTKESRDCRYYRARLGQFSAQSHVTAGVMPAGA